MIPCSLTILDYSYESVPLFPIISMIWSIFGLMIICISKDETKNFWLGFGLYAFSELLSFVLSIYETISKGKISFYGLMILFSTIFYFAYLIVFFVRLAIDSKNMTKDR